MNDTNLISAETALKAPPAPGNVRAGLAGYAEWSGSPPVLTDAVELIDQQAQRIAELEAERDALHDELNEWRFTNGVDVMRRELDRLRARLAQIEAQEPVAHYRASDVEWLAMGRCATVYKAQEEDWKVPLYARPVPAQAVPGTKAARDVLAERRRQVEVEGWTPEHDDKAHLPDELAIAASCYCVADEDEAPPAVWPWDWSWWKPYSRRSNMVRAAALLLAEIERLDRASAPEQKTAGCGACGDACAKRGSCRLADESPEAAR